MICIPTSFRLMNRKYVVEELTASMAQELGMHGDCNRAKAVIRVELDDPANSRHTFYHELAHALLHVSTKPKLSDNEDFVDSLGAAIHQFIQTKKGKLTK